MKRMFHMMYTPSTSQHNDDDDDGRYFLATSSILLHAEPDHPLPLKFQYHPESSQFKSFVEHVQVQALSESEFTPKSLQFGHTLKATMAKLSCRGPTKDGGYNPTDTCAGP